MNTVLILAALIMGTGSVPVSRVASELASLSEGIQGNEAIYSRIEYIYTARDYDVSQVSVHFEEEDGEVLLVFTWKAVQKMLCTIPPTSGEVVFWKEKFAARDGEFYLAEIVVGQYVPETVEPARVEWPE